MMIAGTAEANDYLLVQISLNLGPLATPKRALVWLLQHTRSPKREKKRRSGLNNRRVKWK